MSGAMVASSAKLQGLSKRVKLCRKLHLKDEQRLFKLYSDKGTIVYKKHILEQENTFLTNTTPSYQPKKMIHYRKQINFRKMFLKESQKLAKKRWDLACCKTKKENLLQENEAMCAWKK